MPWERTVFSLDNIFINTSLGGPAISKETHPARRLRALDYLTKILYAASSRFSKVRFATCYNQRCGHHR